MNIYYKRFIDFFKEYNLYDDEAFKYLLKNATMFDYLDDELRPYIGCFCVKDKRKGKLQKIMLVVPFIDNDITALINVHEFMHGFIAYKRLGKKFDANSDDIEMLSMAVEKMYSEKYLSESLTKYEEKLDKSIDDNSEIKYQLGLKYRDELINDLNSGKSLKKLNRKTKRLAKRW